MNRLFTTNRNEFIRFINCIEDLIFVMEVAPSSELRYLIINKAAEERLKLHNSIIGKKLEEVMEGKTAMFLHNKYQEVLKLKKKITYEFTLDNVKYEESILSPIINEKGDITHIISVSRDISARIYTEKKLKESEERYRLIAENSKGLIQLLNRDGVITYASPSHEKVLNLKANDLMHKKLEEIDRLIGDGELHKSLRNVLQTNRPNSHEWKINNKANELYIAVDLIPIKENAKVEKILLIGENITERKMYENEIRKMAFYDYLTGLPNTRLLNELFEKRICSSGKGNRYFALLYIDCDRFKPINDTYGHAVGDQFLKELAFRLKSCISEDDIAARIGGDEFNILLTNIKAKEDIKKNIMKILTETRKPWIYEGTVINLSISIGVSMYPEDGTDLQTLVDKADEALYLAKEEGRNCFVIYGEEMQIQSLI